MRSTSYNERTVSTDTSARSRLTGEKSAYKFAPNGRRSSVEREFERLYMESYGLVYNYVRYRMGDDTETEDIVAEAYMLAARSFHKFDAQRAKFSTWVTKIAINCMNSHFRKARSTVALEAVSEAQVSEGGAQEAVDNRAVVDQLLGALTDEERILVLMKYHEDKRNVDIARELNMNASTVSTKLANALQKMRAVLERNE